MANNIKEFWSGSPYQQIQLPIRNPQQISGMEQLLQRGLAGSNFEPIAQEASRKYKQDTLPSLAERFGSLTGQGTKRSGGFERFAAQQGADLESQLGALRAQHGLKEAEMGLKPTFETMFSPPTQGFAAPFTGQVAGAAGQVGTQALGTWLNELIKPKMAPQSGGQQTGNTMTDTTTGLATEAAKTAAGAGMGSWLSSLFAPSGTAGGTAAAAATPTTQATGTAATSALSSMPAWLGPVAAAIGIPLGIAALLYKLGAFEQVEYPYDAQGRRIK